MVGVPKTHPLLVLDIVVVLGPFAALSNPTTVVPAAAAAVPPAMGRLFLTWPMLRTPEEPMPAASKPPPAERRLDQSRPAAADH